jgi:uncharacterized RDD family membrane protein YckC
MSRSPGSAVVAASALAVPDQDIVYVGLATRAIAFALDGAVINLVATVVGVGAALILSILHLPHAVKEVLVAIGGAAYIAWVVGYFVVFWSTTGQTPGARVMQFRVLASDRARLKPRRAVVRCAGVLAAAIPLFAGFLPILFDAKRRGLQDYLARTIVVETRGASVADTRRARKRAEYLASRQPPTSPLS